MAVPGIITGSNIFGEFTADPTASFTPSQRRGVYGKNPGSTPKYAINRGPVKAEYEETTARLFIDIPEGVERDNFEKTVTDRSKPLARVLTSGAGTAGAAGTGFIDFILTNANENFQEKAQIVDTLTDNYVAYYSGQEPPVFGYSGVLLNTYQDDQRVWMLLMYREILRGTRLANRQKIAHLRYDSFTVSGYMETLSLSLSGETDNTASQFSFTMRVKSMQVMTPALALPTLTSTSASGISISDRVEAVESEVNPRNALVTGTYNASNQQVPAGTATSLARKKEQEKAITILKAAGKTDAEIQGIIALSKIAEEERNSAPNTDARAVETDPNTQATERLVGAAIGTDKTTSNLDNLNSDGQRGSSNVRGIESASTAATQPTAYVPPRSQSGLPPDNTQAAAVVAITGQRYTSLAGKLKAIRKKRTRGRYIQQTSVAGSDGQAVDVRITR